MNTYLIYFRKIKHVFLFESITILMAFLLVTAMTACTTTRPAEDSINSSTSRPNIRLIKNFVDTAQLKEENNRLILQSPTAAFSRASFLASNGIAIPYRLLTPPVSANAAQVKYPLVIMMHGSGQIGTDNVSQLSNFARSWAQPQIQAAFPAYVLVPQVPKRSADYVLSPHDGKLMSNVTTSLQAVVELIEHTINYDANQYAIDKNRIYIVGFSMGASAAWNALVLRPQLFAGALTFSGIAPDRQLANVVRNTSIMIVHGNADEENPIDADRAMFATLSALPQHSNVSHQFQEIEGLQHRVPPAMLFGTEWRQWLFAQRRTDLK